MTPSMPQPPFDIPAATHDETAPRMMSIRGDMRYFRLRKTLEKQAISESAFSSARETATPIHHMRGHSIDENVLPLDKLFR